MDIRRRVHGMITHIMHLKLLSINIIETILLNQTEKRVIPYPSETRLGDGEKRYSPGKLKIVAISLN